jgi:hypothetical protein
MKLSRYCYEHCMNELSPLYPRWKYDESSVQLTELHSVDTPQDQPNPRPHVIKWTLNHHCEKYGIALATVIHCKNALDIDPGQCWALNSAMWPQEVFKSCVIRPLSGSESENVQCILL